jgi:hypothetical protein
MVCFREPLPRVINSVNFCRGDWRRAFFYQDHVGLERCVDSSDLTVESDVTNFNEYLTEDLKFQHFFIEMNMAVSIFYSVVGFVYGAAKLLEYYRIIEKNIP